MKIKDQEFSNINELILMLQAENEHQLRKWGIQTHAPSEWLMFLGEEYGELCQAVLEHQFADGNKLAVVEEAIQTATLALKIAEMYMEKKCQEKK